jgi:hypothetical protein
MKKRLIPMVVCLSAMTLLAGCTIDMSFGGGKKDTASTTKNTTTSNNSTANNNQHPNVGPQVVEPTIGQQLIDLKKAWDAGVITEAEYQAEKAKLLANK